MFIERLFHLSYTLTLIVVDSSESPIFVTKQLGLVLVSLYGSTSYFVIHIYMYNVYLLIILKRYYFKFTFYFLLVIYFSFNCLTVNCKHKLLLV